MIGGYQRTMNHVLLYSQHWSRQRVLDPKTHPRGSMNAPVGWQFHGENNPLQIDFKSCNLHFLEHLQQTKSHMVGIVQNWECWPQTVEFVKLNLDPRTWEHNC